MKAIELLDIVNCQCTLQESYGVFRYFSAKHDLDKMMPDDLSEYMRDYFLGTDGEVVSCNWSALQARKHLVVMYPTNDEEFHHDFFPIGEEILFSGVMSNGQYVFICGLE